MKVLYDDNDEPHSRFVYYNFEEGKFVFYGEGYLHLLDWGEYDNRQPIDVKMSASGLMFCLELTLPLADGRELDYDQSCVMVSIDKSGNPDMTKVYTWPQVVDCQKILNEYSQENKDAD